MVIAYLSVISVSAQNSPAAPEPEEKPVEDPLFFKKLDTDGNGSLTLEEFSKARRIKDLSAESIGKLFQRFDKNADGVLTRDEVKTKVKTRYHKFAKTIQSLDVDQNREISYEEFLKHPRFGKLSKKHQERIFSRMDKNGDGVISLKDWVAKRKAKQKEGQ